MSNPLTPERVKELLVQVERHKAVTDSGGDARPVPVEWPILLALLTLADAYDSQARELAEVKAEAADWVLVADGVTHDCRCCHGEAETPLCLRCQVEQLTAERDALKAKVEQVVQRWRREASEYPASETGAAYAQAAVRLCANELAAILKGEQ